MDFLNKVLHKLLTFPDSFEIQDPFLFKNSHACLPNQSLYIFIVIPIDFFFTKNINCHQIHRHIEHQFQTSQLITAPCICTQSEHQKGQQKIPHFDHSLQRQLNNGANHKHNVERNSLLFQVQGHGQTGIDKNRYCCIACPPIPPVESVPHVEGVVSIVGQQIGMDQCVVADNEHAGNGQE
jgi:hypothetical protein